MKKKWNAKKLAYFTKPSPAAERNDDWIIWALIAVCSLAGAFYLLFKVVI